MLDTCSQGIFTTTNLMEQLKISGIPEMFVYIQILINIETLIDHQKESSYIVEGLSVSYGHSTIWAPEMDQIASSILKERNPSGLL